MLIAIVAAMLPLTILWTFAQRWRFPDLFPSRYTLRFWEYEWEGMTSVMTQSLSIALISATIALLLAVIGHEYRIKYRLQVPGYVIAIPMLVPQLSILFGLQVVTLMLSDGHYLLWVCWSHVFFAFPYVYLALDGPWRGYNNTFTQLSLSLGKSPIHTWLYVKLPQLLPAMVFAWAIGISVSLAQYLPTLFSVLAELPQSPPKRWPYRVALIGESPPFMRCSKHYCRYCFSLSRLLLIAITLAIVELK